jgi:hypothetical protein
VSVSGDAGRRVELVLDTLHAHTDLSGGLWYDWAAIALAQLSPTATASSAALHEEGVWPLARRAALLEKVPTLAQVNRRFGQVNPAALPTKGGRNLALLISEARALVLHEGGTTLREWHILKAIADTDADHTIARLGVRAAALLESVAALEGRVALGADDLRKVWCVCDANVFLQYHLFDQVDWPAELGYPAVVLVVPTAVLRALDRYKSDPTRERQQKRARQVLPRFAHLALDGGSVAGQPARVRHGVELLLQDREPPIPAGFDAGDPDDRIVADALDFRWRHPGARVVVLSGDHTVRLKARANGLEQRTVPERLELPSVKPPSTSEVPSGED